MGKIIVLDENSINKIAAGEVIERPLSIVKELVENSIDAGASKITMEIKNGGIILIKITDDGKGIDPDDVELAFERHATGKIRSADDLPKVMTMGFRGEALSSIAAVSEVELFTRTIDNDFGMNVFIKGGNIMSVKQIGCPVGTNITVRNLFFNTPARFKFLKKDAIEAGYISDIMTRLALSAPQISFKFISNGTTLLHTPGNNDLSSTIYSIYGREISQNLIFAEYKDEKFIITGYVGNSAVARSNRSQQSLFVNNRFVKNKTVTAAIDEAYKTMIMKNKFAFCVLKIDINPLMIDVNVHPNKMEIKFSEEGELFRSVYHTINNALTKDIILPEFKTVNKQVELVPHIDNFKQNILKTSDYKFYNKTDDESNHISKPNIQYEPNNKSELNADCQTNSNPEITVDYGNDIHEENKTDLLVSEDPPESENNKDYFEQLLEEGTIIGQGFMTYIIIQLGEQLVFIDQHAAHERIRFEELVHQYENAQLHGQNLLTPEIVEVSPKEKILIKAEKEFISSLGFEYEDFGQNSIMIRQVPLKNFEYSPAMLFKEIIDKIDSMGDRAKAQAKEILYDIACKGAIKANKKLDNQEILQILRGLADLKTATTCPHGRPIILKMTKYFIEKEFKRII
ncbi:MAG TPA: DNA mismatch repair endonuclease MutL [Clostridia bacterium]|nr:DNA mismatch repair endonuclease MutL [Clostridia bacterium]